jgi:LysM repeat protein
VAYTVKPNDTLSSLARRTGKSVQKLQAANCLAGTLVFAGQILYIPSVPPPQSDGSYATFPTATVWVPKTGLPGHEKIEVKPRTGSPGTGFEFHVTDYASFEPVRVVIRLDRDGTLAEEKTVPTDREGNLSYTYNSPLNAKPGDYNIFVQGTITINRDGNGSFSITEPSPTTYP